MHALAFSQVSKRYQRPHLHRAQDALWALRDVTFTAEPGEAIGVLGRNGSGKSTLLKLAAGVMRPSSGTVRTARPVAPMLELGAGFHPDLSGRDNVMLNGGLIGLDPQRLTPAVFDEIVAFAELEDHIDAPVKHYSSGMYARLGFAVAVHSPARILLVDEVLSVGDALFRHKCLERMRTLRDQGVAILLVSHDLWAIATFCTRALVLEGGRLAADALPDQALRFYEESLRHSPDAGRTEGWFQDLTVRTAGEGGGGGVHQLEGTELDVAFRFDTKAARAACCFVVRIQREDGVCCSLSLSDPAPPGSKGMVMLRIAGLNLVPGRYLVKLTAVDTVLPASFAELVGAPFVVPDASGKPPEAIHYGGVIRTESHWRMEPA